MVKLKSKGRRVLHLLLDPRTERTGKECASKLQLHYITARFNFGGESSGLEGRKEGREGESRERNERSIGVAYSGIARVLEGKHIYSND